jgi:hypothetical protein
MPQGVSGGSSNDCPICPQPKEIASQCPVPVCKTGEHFDPKVNECVPDVITCPKDQHYDTNQKKCVPDNCPKNQHYESKLNKCVPNPPCKKDERYDAVQNKCVPVCPDGTGLLNGKCPTKTLSLSISVNKDPIIRGHEQTITVTVSDKDIHIPIDKHATRKKR